MNPLVLPAVGVVLWLAHAATTLTGRPSWGLRLAVMLGLPAAALSCYAVFFFGYPRKHALKIYEQAPGEEWLVGMVICFLLWVVLLIAEPVLLLLSRGLARLRTAQR